MPKAIIWTYQGDMRCPCCGVYSPVYSKGYHFRRILRLKCKTTGQEYRKSMAFVGTAWKPVDKFSEENDGYNAVLREEVEKLCSHGSDTGESRDNFKGYVNNSSKATNVHSHHEYTVSTYVMNVGRSG